MKRVAALLNCHCLVPAAGFVRQRMAYKPVKFIAPELRRQSTHLLPRLLWIHSAHGNVTLLYTLSKLGVMTQTIYYVHLSDPDATPVKIEKTSGTGRLEGGKPDAVARWKAGGGIIFSPYWP